tara:strand:+ start:213 stop:584 length:372 start_codon:yes stop_codon:yes gene_type:complete
MMDIFEELNEENFTLFAIRHYDNPQCTSTEEFYEDIRRFRYLKRLLRRYYNSGELRERLILNHLIILNNVFGVENAVRMLQYKIDDEYWPVLKTSLLYLEYIDEGFRVEIPLDKEAVKRMREL